MENNDKLNPFVSGGILTNDGDYYKKDDINIEKNSLKASLELLTKIKNQKKGEINALNQTYLKEISAEQTSPNVELFDEAQQDALASANTENNVVADSTQTERVQQLQANNSTSNDAQYAPAGISFADLDNENQNSIVEKEEYIPDYRAEQPAQPYDNYTNPEIVAFEQQTAVGEPQPEYVVEPENKSKKREKRQLVPSDKETISEGRGVAWLAYILFFIPLLIKKDNTFVRWHANEGLKVFFLDIIGAALFCVGWFVKSSNALYTSLLLCSLAAGVIALILSLFTRFLMIIFALAGKEAQHPWFFKAHIIK